MYDKTADIMTVCSVFGLDPEQIESGSCIRRKDQLFLDVKLKDTRPVCPDCGHASVRIKGYVPKKINHSVLSDRGCQILYHARRYVCPVCGRTYYEANPFVFKRMKISSQVVLSVMKDLMRPTETFTSVAQRYHISPTTAAALFDHTVNIPRARLPKILSIDENYAFFSREQKSKYVCVLIDQRNGRPIDILPSRRYEYLDKYYTSIPACEKEQVEFVATDMYEPYRRIIRKHFRQARHVVDRYHVAQELNRKIDAVRLRIMKPYRYINHKKRTREQKDAYYLLKHQNKLLFRHFHRSLGRDRKPLFDIHRKRSYSQHFQKHMNPYDIARELMAIHPDIRKAWELRDEVTDFYDRNSGKTAPEALNRLIKKLRESEIEELIAFSKTLNNWKEEILNSFCISKAVYITGDTGKIDIEYKRVSNALMENRNAIIKLITKSANGYHNWDRFRNRCMLVLEKEIDFEISREDGSVRIIAKKEPDS